MNRLSWRALNDVLTSKSEDEVLELLNQERAHFKRVAVLQRLHQRYCTLRDARERHEILSEAVRP
jgi:hypothetical protein